MQVDAYDSNDVGQLKGARVVILQAKWHDDLTSIMTKKCSETLQKAGVESIDVHITPGSLEIPLAAKWVAESKPDAIICFGIIVKGDTYHFDMLMHMCGEGMMDVSLKSGIPVLNEILPVDDIAHAQARAGDNDQNKGIEAALAAVEMIQLRRKINL